MLTQKHVKLQKQKPRQPDTNDPASWLMLASTIQFSNNTHHHTATHPQPTGHGTQALTSSSKQRRRVLSDTQQCADETPPTNPKAGPAGNNNYRVSVPPNNMSNRISHIRADQRYYMLLRKEVIQPHLPVRLPCYDFVPIANPTFDSSLPQGVRPPASGVTDFHDVTGGVYKARERIHRSVADLRLLATPTSWGRVADPNPN